MSRLAGLKMFVHERLSAALEEIFGHFEKTISEYEEELSRRHWNPPDTVWKTGPDPREAASVWQLLATSEDVPTEQQESLDKQHQTLVPQLIKEEPHANQDGELLQGQQDVDVIKFTFDPVHPEDEEEEKPMSSALQEAMESPSCSSSERVKTETDEGGGSEPVGSFDPDGYLQPDSEEDEAWTESRDPLSGLMALNNKIVSTILVRDERTINEDPKSFTCSLCRKSFERRETLNRHMMCHSSEKPHSCSVCKRRFRWRGDFVSHLRTHTGEKPFMCSDCGKSFIKHGTLTRHKRIHTGERPHVCSNCGRGFHRKEDLTKHVRTHTGEKPFNCGICNRSFSRLFRVKNHKCVVGSNNHSD